MGGSTRAVLSHIGTHKAINGLSLEFLSPAAFESKNFVVVHRHRNTGRIAAIDPEF